MYSKDNKKQPLKQNSTNDLKTKAKVCKVFVYAFVVVCFFLYILSVYAAGKFEFYYFNPDSAQSNFSHLTKGFGSFLRKAGLEASFQAFTQKVDFDQRVKDKSPALVYVPSWYYEKYGKVLGLKPLLTSLENGQPNYTKVLLIRKANEITIDDLDGRTVAMTTMGPDTEELLNNNFFKVQGISFSAMNIIVTPKDADALYALALGQVDTALVSRTTLQMVGRVNNKILDGLEELVVSAPVPMPLLCVTPGTMDTAEIERLKRIFKQGGHKAIRPKYMEMLNINGWQNVL